MIRRYAHLIWLVALMLFVQVAAAEGKPKVKIAFILEHLLVRGTEVATFDYADFNETLLGNESYIVFLNNEKIQWAFNEDHSSEVHKLFVSRFGADRFFECRSIEEANLVLMNQNIDMVYWQANGARDERIAQLCKKTAVHAIFTFPHWQGDAFAAISKWLGQRSVISPSVSYIVRPPCDTTSTLHDMLNIPRDAVVFGRSGGYYTFDIGYVKQAIERLAQDHKDWYFIFLNTEKFSTLPNVLFLEKTWDTNLKERFINTCDAMIHARSDGETFGLACAEFSVRNKPIITCLSGDLAHLDILGDKALVYRNQSECINHLKFCAHYKKRLRSKDWDAYSKDYSPEAIMKQFNEIFILPLTKVAP